jgi:hypothetical protein
MYIRRVENQPDPHFEPHFAQLDDMHGALHERLPGETGKQFTSRMANMPGRKSGARITHFHEKRPRRVGIA